MPGSRHNESAIELPKLLVLHRTIGDSLLLEFDCSNGHVPIRFVLGVATPSDLELVLCLLTTSRKGLRSRLCFGGAFSVLHGSNVNLVFGMLALSFLKRIARRDGQFGTVMVKGHGGNRRRKHR
jgi:hypothetical protein